MENLGKEGKIAGLIRFVYKEAIKREIKQKKVNLKLPEKIKFPGVSNAVRNIFPFFLIFGKFQRHIILHFADAENLVMFNFDYVSKNINDLMPGDLLVFNKNNSSLEPWHLMLYVGKEYNKPLAIYHNGDKGKYAKIRIVSINDLSNSPDPQWMPNHNNPFFMGIYKWKSFQKIKNYRDIFCFIFNNIFHFFMYSYFNNSFESINLKK